MSGRFRAEAVARFAVVAGLACIGAYGQVAGPMPEFEVASIKPSPAHDTRRWIIEGGPGSKDPERFVAVHTELAFLILYAYRAQFHPYRAPPSWMEEAYFDVEARVPPGTTKDQFFLMLQNLLVERFRVKVHQEPKEMAVYELVVAKSGPKLRESTDQDQPAPPPQPGVLYGITTRPDGFPVLPPGNGPTVVVVPKGKVGRRGRQETLADIADDLSHPAGRPVLDRTGLKGTYDYTLYYDIFGNQPSASSAANAGAVGSLADVDRGPTLFQAVQQQLGLKLQPAKEVVPVFVIDSADKMPSDN